MTSLPVPPACRQGRAGTLKWAKICPPWRESLQHFAFLEKYTLQLDTLNNGSL